MKETDLRVLIAGGGTGGHFFPARAIGDELKKMGPHYGYHTVDILYLGTKYGIEYEVFKEENIPYKLLWIRGFYRGFTPLSILRNIIFPFRLCISTLQSMKIIKEFNPHIVIGTGGYVSGPPLWVATRKGKLTVIQEQNSYPGITTRLLAQKADFVFISYQKTLEYLDIEHYKITGNPVRLNIHNNSRENSREFFNLSRDKTTIFIFGGSQGSISMNNHFRQYWKSYCHELGVQLIWQTGIFQFKEILHEVGICPEVHLSPFIKEMNLAYSASDLIICRSGAISLAEITVLGKAAILIPYPYAAANHQYHNARMLEEAKAAKVVLNHELQGEKLFEETRKILSQPYVLKEMENRAKSMGKSDALEKITQKIFSLLQTRLQ
jgi:UDP-N-acetylglucosamine--N-acetylmuramyl-(pentapeptide) pyrophosphoryl-undecaprenol N-acetylglucosamine transferase